MDSRPAHGSLILRGQAGQPRIVLIMVPSEARESKPHHADTFHVHVESANIPWVKPSHIVEVKSKCPLPVEYRMSISGHLFCNMVSAAF